MPLVASTGSVLVRCWQHRPSTGPVLATNGMFMGRLQSVKIELAYLKRAHDKASAIWCNKYQVSSLKIESKLDFRVSSLKVEFRI